ncbi:MAG: hypothetical protein HC915_21250 [Anaerolineae bacterium]|nr:hypothetical protein [Anaerolineae bacterium]
MFALTILAALGGDGLARALHHRDWPRRALIAAGLALVGVTLALAIGRSLERYAEPPGRVHTYPLIGAWIRQQTPADARLLVGDLGIMGYYARRPTLDSPALITPQMHFTLDGYAAAKFRPDLVVGTGYYTWVELTQQAWFRANFRPLAGFSTPGDSFSPMTVYARRYPLENPRQVYAGLPFALHCPLELPEDAPLPTTTRALLQPTQGQALTLEQPFLNGQYPAPRTPAPETLHEQLVITQPLAPGEWRWLLDCGAAFEGQLTVLPTSDIPGYTPLQPAPHLARTGSLVGLCPA